MERLCRFGKFFLRSGKGADLFKGFKAGFKYNLNFSAL